MRRVLLASVIGGLLVYALAGMLGGAAEAQVSAHAYSTPGGMTCTKTPVDIDCGTGITGYRTFAVMNTGDTTNKIVIGYSGMTENNRATTGFEYCAGCAAGAVYSAAVNYGMPKCASVGVDGGLPVRVQCFQ